MMIGAMNGGGRVLGLTLRGRLIPLVGYSRRQIIGSGVNQITPKGHSYLSGDADLRDEEKPE